MHFFGAAIFREIAFPMAAYIYSLERLVSAAYRGERFVAISASTKADILARCGAKTHVDVVEPGIDTAFYRPTRPKEPTPTLIYFGRLKKYKNIQTVIRSLPAIRRAVPGARLIVAGTGDYRPALEALTRRMGLEAAVSFAGFVSEEEKLGILSSATLKINPSVKEGWGITNIEAALCGTVSVSANVPGLRDSVRDGVTGLLFDLDDQADFVAKALLPNYREFLEGVVHALSLRRSDAGVKPATSHAGRSREDGSPCAPLARGGESPALIAERRGCPDSRFPLSSAHRER
jgi:glycosyltransferase involved in cell wall biosynthesis